MRIPKAIPRLKTITSFCARAVANPKGHDVDMSEAQAFMRQFFKQLGHMRPVVRGEFIEFYVKYYQGKDEPQLPKNWGKMIPLKKPRRKK